MTVFFFFEAATHILTASAAAVGPSYIEALAQGRPVRLLIMVCHSKM